MSVETFQNDKSLVVISMRDSFISTQLTFGPADNWMEFSICSEKLEAKHPSTSINAVVANHTKGASLIVVLLTCCRFWITMPTELPSIETLTTSTEPIIDYCAINDKKRRILV